MKSTADMFGVLGEAGTVEFKFHLDPDCDCSELAGS